MILSMVTKTYIGIELLSLGGTWDISPAEVISGRNVRFEMYKQSRVQESFRVFVEFSYQRQSTSLSSSNHRDILFVASLSDSMS